MAKVNYLLSWFRGSISVEDPLLRRMDCIRGHRLDWSVPTVSVFSGRKVLSQAE